MDPLLEVRGISRSFGGVQAIRDCSLTAGKGQVTGIIGPNGAGKSTLFNLITGFLEPDRGEIHFNGEQITGWAAHRIARRGLVRTFQVPQGFPGLTVFENMLAAPRMDVGESAWQAVGWQLLKPGRLKRAATVIDEARHLLQKVGLWEKRNQLVKNLSPGEGRMLEIARQLMLHPQMILLDEPTAGVHPILRERLTDLLRELRREFSIGIVLIEHNLSFIMNLSDVIFVLNRGSVIAHGAPEEISRDPKVIEIYLGGGRLA